MLFLIGFKEEHTFYYFNEDAEKALEAAAGASELLEPPESIFPTEVVEELAKI